MTPKGQEAGDPTSQVGKLRPDVLRTRLAVVTYKQGPSLPATRGSGVAASAPGARPPGCSHQPRPRPGLHFGSEFLEKLKPLPRFPQPL